MKCLTCGGYVMDCSCADREIVPTPVRKPIYKVSRHRAALARSVATKQARAVVKRLELR